MAVEPFWPRHSPHFLECRRAVRRFGVAGSGSGASGAASDGAVGSAPGGALAALAAPALIGVSGGPDSLALVAAAAAEGVDARAVVVDHGLQAGSAEVAERACAAASSLGVPASVVPVTVNAAAGESIEAAARGVRYEALFAAAASDGRDVWVAHTLDDQAETLILGALRGNPSGMAEVTPGEGEVAVVRPFLSVRRASTVGACAELGLSPWHDPMNEDPSYRRVAVRKEIIPALSEVLGGDAVPPVAGAAARIAADQELLAALVDVSPSTDCAELAAAPAPVRQRRILAWLRAEGVAVNGAQLADIERLCTDWHGQGPVTVGSGRSVARDEARLVLRASS